MDSYSLYLNYEFWFYAKKHKIFLFRLFPHSTHFTQPIDVSCFQLFKHYHTYVINRILQLADVEFGKLQLMAELQAIREKIFTKTAI